MTWELYEVWRIDPQDREELVDTTPSLKQARLIAQSEDQWVIYREDDAGNITEVERGP